MITRNLKWLERDVPLQSHKVRYTERIRLYNKVGVRLQKVCYTVCYAVQVVARIHKFTCFSCEYYILLTAAASVVCYAIYLH